MRQSADGGLRRHAEWDGPEGGVNDGTNGSGNGGLTCFKVDQSSGRLSAGESVVALPHCMAVTLVQTTPSGNL